MLCEKCGKRVATTYIKTIVNGISTEQHLCELCANSGPKTTLESVFASMLTNSTETEKHCAVCGLGFEDIAKSGRAGCSECYKTFKDQLLPYLKRVHGSTKHIGKLPQDKLFKAPRQTAVEALKTELMQLIEHENYEQAAVVRDKIRELEASQ